MIVKMMATKIKFFTVLLLFLGTILFGSVHANASCGSNHIKSGLGIFSANSLSCGVEKFPNQTCYIASTQSQTQGLLTARCVLDGGFVWREPGAFDFRVNIGFSSHIINLSIRQGNHCFEAKNGATGNSAFILYRLCDTTRAFPFSRTEVRVLLENKGKFGSVGRVSSGLGSRNADNNPSNSSSSSSKLNKAKATCTELGFTPGTEKHGSCVLKVIEN